MPLYIAADGSWGDAIDLVLVNDYEWVVEEWEEMNTWTDLMVIRFADAVSKNPKLTPTQWKKQQNES